MFVSFAEARPRVAVVVGTRPEVIKMAPVVRELKKHENVLETILVTTAQHREMLGQALNAFDLEPDLDLQLMAHNQGLGEFAARSLRALTDAFDALEPNVVLLQGDTTTVASAAMAAAYKGILVGHVEAGLRSGDKRNPFPEEMNRCMAATFADLHFAPTPLARLNLLREGIREDAVFMTGNTIVDAVQSYPRCGPFESEPLRFIDFEASRVLLVTAHRRESQGTGLYSICRAMKRIVSDFPDVQVVFPVHLNPNVRRVVEEQLRDVPQIHLVEPVCYGDMLRLLERCYFVLSDSGGVQEEAPSFGTPVLILRETTERPEVVEVGTGKLVGTDPERIYDEAATLLLDEVAYARMSGARNPFGDGKASERIVQVLIDRLVGVATTTPDIVAVDQVMVNFAS